MLNVIELEVATTGVDQKRKILTGTLFLFFCYDRNYNCHATFLMKR